MKIPYQTAVPSGAYVSGQVNQFLLGHTSQVMWPVEAQPVSLGALSTGFDVFPILGQNTYTALAMAQQFTAPTGYTTLQRIILLAPSADTFNIGSGGDVIVSLQAASGSVPSGVPLAECYLPAEWMGTNNLPIPLFYSGLVAGNVYFVVFQTAVSCVPGYDCFKLWKSNAANGAFTGVYNNDWTWTTQAYGYAIELLFPTTGSAAYPMVSNTSDVIGTMPSRAVSFSAAATENGVNQWTTMMQYTMKSQNSPINMLCRNDSYAPLNTGTWTAQTNCTIAQVTPTSGSAIQMTQVGSSGYMDMTTGLETKNILSANDSSFEGGIGTWACGNATLTQSTDFALNGAHSLKIAGNWWDTSLSGLSPTAWWKLADAAGSATVVDQEGSNAYPGTINGTVTLAEAGPFPGIPADTSALFDGSTGYITTTYNPTATAVSVGCWFKRNATQSGNPRLLDNDHTGADNKGFELFLNSGTTPEVDFGNGTAFGQVLSPTAITDTNWHFVCATWDGTTVTLYVDGASVASVAFSGSMVAGSTGVWVAAGVYSADYFAGEIAQAFVCATTAYSAAQIQALYYQTLIAQTPNSANPPTYPVQSGLPYTALMSARSDLGQAVMHSRLEFSSGSPTAPSYTAVASPDATPPANSWVQMPVSGTTPANAIGADVALQVGLPMTETVYIDEVALYQSAAPVNLVPDTSDLSTWTIGNGTSWSIAPSPLGGKEWRILGNGVGQDFRVFSQAFYLPAGTYTASAYIDSTYTTGGGADLQVLTPPWAAPSYLIVSQVSGAKGTVSGTFTLSSAAPVIFGFQVVNSVTVENGQYVTFAQPQLVLGSTAPPYTAGMDWYIGPQSNNLGYPVIPGKYYSAYFDFWAVTTDRFCYGVVDVHASDGTWITSYPSIAVTDTVNGPSLNAQVVFSAPTNAAWARLRAAVTGAAAGEQHNVSNVIFAQYDGPILWSWPGQVTASVTTFSFDVNGNLTSTVTT